MIQRRVTVVNALGLHARAAARFVEVAGRFKSHVTVTCGHHTMDGKSILGVMSLGAERGTAIEISADGSDEQNAVTELCGLTERGFKE
jgi:phosphotransferase system HPr (HPr) family protein